MRRRAARRERLLRAGDDGDLLRLTAYAARTAEVIGDGLAQRHVAGGVRAHEMASGDAAQAARGDLCPERDGEEIEGGEVGTKRARGARFVAGEKCGALRV
jgi:hypothetical protein